MVYKIVTFPFVLVGFAYYYVTLPFRFGFEAARCHDQESF